MAIEVAKMQFSSPKIKWLMVVAGVALMAGAPVVAGPLVASKTVDIAFVGYCDGLHLVINQNNGLVTGNFTGCVGDPVSGVVGAFSKNGAGVAVVSLYTGTTTVMFAVDDDPKNWTARAPDGTLLNSGTYTVGVPLGPQVDGARPAAMTR